MNAIDLATETAEGFVLPPAGVPFDDLKNLRLASTGRALHQRHLQARYDEEVWPFLSSAHLACGMHSGDPLLMRRIARELLARNIRLGAHPSYPDVFGFGQQRVAMDGEDLEAVIVYQLGALAAVVSVLGARLEHVKCHGKLAFDISYEERICAVMVAAVKKLDPEMIVVFMAGSPGIDYARGKGLRVAAEGYIDRGYDDKGHLVPRDHPQALIKEPARAAARALEIVCERKVTSVDGKIVPLEAHTLCLHSDTAGAGAIAAAVANAIKNRGVAVRPLAEVVQ